MSSPVSFDAMWLMGNLHLFTDQYYCDNHRQLRRPMTFEYTTPKPTFLGEIIKSLLAMQCTIQLVYFLLVFGIIGIYLIRLFVHKYIRRHNPRLHRRRRRGLSRKDIRQLPRFKFDGGLQGPECVICFDWIRRGDIFRILPACSHAFHLVCIDPWLAKAPACPICLTRVSAESEIGVDDECNLLWTVRARVKDSSLRVF